MMSRIRIGGLAQRKPISKHIYGHFIEHLGRCIYGGVWAEMLANRKFWGIGGDARVDHRVVPKWKPVALSRSVRYDHDNTIFYSGGQSQRIDLLRKDSSWHGLVQHGLHVKRNMKYVGRLVFRTRSFEGQLCVRLRAGTGKEVQVTRKPHAESRWSTWKFDLTPCFSSKRCEFRIEVKGTGRVWLGAVSLMPSDNVKGFRRDVLELVRALKPANIRWPGGNFVSGYQWCDGISDPDRRPTRLDQAWGAFEYNDVGTDEFIEFCRLVDAEPYICVNAGSGTAQDAADWVEYCNGDSASTNMGKLRASQGHREPYDVNLWGVGNEMYGFWQIGHVDVETFARRTVEFARKMKRADPSITLVGVGSQDYDDSYPGWDERFLPVAGRAIDLLSYHQYFPCASYRARLAPKTTDAELDPIVLGSASELETRLKQKLARNDRVKGCSELPYAVDEWNVWLDGTVKNGLEEGYCLRDGLTAAGALHVFHRLSDRVSIANVAQLINVLGILSSDQSGSWETAIAMAIRLYANHFGTRPVTVRWTSPTFKVPKVHSLARTRQGRFIDVSVALNDAEEAMTVAVVNAHPTKDSKFSLDFGPWRVKRDAVAYELNGQQMHSRNLNAKDLNCWLKKKKVIVEGTYTFPAHSVTLLVLETES
jgi:alpha-N-arabinofuranosidase